MGTGHGAQGGRTASGGRLAASGVERMKEGMEERETKRPRERHAVSGSPFFPRAVPRTVPITYGFIINWR